MKGADGTSRNWNLEMTTCTCEQCELATTSSTGMAGEDADQKARLLERHRFSRLDHILGVDEPIALVERRVPNRVPVLVLRLVFSRAVHLDPRDPDRDALAMLCIDPAERELYDFVFCSFTRTSMYMATKAGAEAFQRIVEDRLEYLQNKAQIIVPKAVIEHPDVHVLSRSVYLRICIAYMFIHKLTNDIRYEYDTNPFVQDFVYNMQLFADTHLDICLYCDVMSCHNDHFLTKPIESFVLRTQFGEMLDESRDQHAAREIMSDCVKFSPLERCYPHPLRAVAAGEMIDMTCAIQQSNVWTAVRPELSSRTSSFIHVFMGKALNHKCVAEGTLVSRADGTSVRIEDLEEGTLLSVPVPVDQPCVDLATCERVVETGTKECIRLTLEDGRTLDITPDHRVLTSSGQWVEAKDLSVGLSSLSVEPSLDVDVGALTLELKLVDSRPIGPRRVFDISSPKHESFFANGVAVHNCMVRGFDDMMSAEVGKQPVLSAVLMNLVELSMLGNYSGPHYRPMWMARMLVRRSHHWDAPELHTWCSACHRDEKVFCPECKKQPTKRDAAHGKHRCDFCMYIKKNKFLVFFAVKEYYAYTVRSQGVIHSMLEQEDYWIQHCRMLELSMNDARRILSSPFDNVRDLSLRTIAEKMFLAVDHLALMHDCAKPSSRRRDKSVYFYGVLLRAMSRIHHGNFQVRKARDKQQVIDKWTGYQRPSDFLLAPLNLENGSDEVLPCGPDSRFSSAEIKRFYACGAALEHLGGKRWCDVYTLDDVERLANFMCDKYGDLVPTLLSQVGMSPSGHKILLDMHYNSQMRDMPDNQMIKNCAIMVSQCAADFHVLYHFLQCMDRWHAVGLFPLDRDQALAQAAALRLRHGIEPWEEIPAGCDIVNVCRNDKRVFCDVVGAAEHEDSIAANEKEGSAMYLDKALYTKGVMSAYYDHHQHGLVCSKAIESANTKSWQKLDLMRALYNGDAQLALSIRVSRETQRECERSTLESFSLLGGVLRVGKTAVTLCVKCACVCTWQDSCMTSAGMTCGREVRFSEADRYTNLQQYTTPVAQQLRERTKGDLYPVRESIILPPMPTGGREDLFDRLTTPVFDTANCYRKIGIMGIGVDVGEEDVDDMTFLMDDRSHIHKDTFAKAAKNRAASRLAARRRDKSGRTRVSQELRDAKFVDRHRVRPELCTEEEWEKATDAEKMMIWTPAGQEYLNKHAELRKSSAVDKEIVMMKLDEKEAARRKALMDNNFYEIEMNLLRTKDLFEETLRQTSRTLNMDALDDSNAIALRNGALELGLIDVKTEIVCAYCSASCDKRGQYIRLIVDNLDDCLVDMRTGDRQGTTGLVYIYLCKKHFDACYTLLRKSCVPRVTDMILHLDDKRKKAANNFLRFKTRR